MDRVFDCRNGYADLLRLMGTERNVGLPRLERRAEGNEQVMRARAVCNGKHRTVARGEPDQLLDWIDAARRDDQESYVV